jgi:hypothetical protein
VETLSTPATASVSLKVLFAAEAQRAVILRRGPRAHFHLILWDIAADVFERGQWFRGVVQLSDLSSDGTRLLYWAAQYHRSRSKPHAAESQLAAPGGVPRRRRKAPRYVSEPAAPVPVSPRAQPFSTWTAISKPPYFTALAVWPSTGTWTGGGYFGGDGAIHVAEFRPDPVMNAGPPDVPIRAVAARSELKRSARVGDVDRDPHQSEVALALSAAGARCVHWVDLSARNGVTFAYDGRVFRSRAGTASAPEDIASKSTLIADFTGLAFEQIPPPPSALHW